MVVRQAGPADFDVGDVVGNLSVEIAELVGDGLRGADDEINRVSCEVGNGGGFGGGGGDFSFFLEAAPEGAKGGFDLFFRVGVGLSDEDGTISGDPARAAG